MNRRNLLKNSFSALAGLSLPLGLENCTGNRGNRETVRNKKLQIRYVREQIPMVEIPAYRGTSYEDMIPDTLDIAERAHLGINAVTRITDPDADYEIYMWVNPFHNPVLMNHDFNDWCQLVEGLMEGLPLLRTITGSDLNADVDSVWMQGLLKSTGPDGLAYVPLDGRPWSREGLGAAPSIEPVWRADGARGRFRDASITQITAPCIWSRALGTTGVYYMRDGNPMWTQGMRKIVDRAATLATYEGDFAYFASGSFEPNARVGSDARRFTPTGGQAVDIGNGRLIQGLAQHYRLTGYEPSAKLAAKLVSFVRQRIDYYDSDGRFLMDSSDRAWANDLYKRSFPSKARQLQAELAASKYGGHFHTHAIGLLSMVEYAIAVNDRELLDWTRSSFEWARTQRGSLVGFMPEELFPLYPSCESCEVADLIAIATKLTRAGVGDYWDDVDRWTRNQFAENQLTESDWVYGVGDRSPRKPVPKFSTGDRVPERNIGAFAGWASGNDYCPRSKIAASWVLENPLMIQHCCTGNSIRALYYIWENILTYDEGRLRVNLLLNRASRSADLYSYIPYEGKVELKMKEHCPSVLVRVPEWVKPHSSGVSMKSNNVPIELRWEARYLNVGAASPGDTISFSFPVPLRKVSESMGGTAYTLETKGNTVISIDPAGRNGPLYRRAAYRANRAPVRKVHRFIPETEITW